VTGSDAVGLTMGHYDTTALPIYRYLHTAGHPRYAIADAFFQSAFGGSFLNHQWLIAANTPTWPTAVNDGGADDLHSVLDANGMPTNSPLYTTAATYPLGDRALTQSCAPAASRGPLQSAYTCGDYAVNTIQPAYQPYAPGTALSRRLPADGADDRRSTQREGRRLGLVLGWLVERQRRHRRPRLDQRRRNSVH
jgi:phospholipase C